jgi:integrase
MASITKQKNGGKVVQFFLREDSGRKSLYLGRASMEFAREMKRTVEALLRAKVEQTVPDHSVLDWVRRLDRKLRKKLFGFGLIEQPAEERAADEEAKKAAKPRLGAFLADYFARRIDVKPATKEIWGQAKRNLLEFFNEERTLESITEGDAEDFARHLAVSGLASMTVHKRLQFAKQFFTDARKRRLIPSNPFSEVKSKGIINRNRHRFIPREDATLLLSACPNLDWRVIISLARYGGLRCPSEVLSLKLEDIDWARKRIRIYSPKTEHHVGKESREIPLFPELEPVLLEAAESTPEGAVYVVNERLRIAAVGPSGWRNCNLRTQFERIIRRGRVAALAEDFFTPCGLPGKRSWHSSTPCTSSPHGWATLRRSR